jgi:hypothetical protein
MKHLYLVILLFLTFIFAGSTVIETKTWKGNKVIKYHSVCASAKDTCLIEGQAFIMSDYRSKRVMRAYIKNSQLYVVNDGLQFAKFRIIGYVFSSLTNEYMPSYRWNNQRISPPILQILKSSRVGEQFLFEEIVVVDQSKKTIANQVRPLMIERVKN